MALKIFFNFNFLILNYALDLNYASRVPLEAKWGCQTPWSWSVCKLPDVGDGNQTLFEQQEVLTTEPPLHPKANTFNSWWEIFLISKATLKWMQISEGCTFKT